ncbi:hypothetical protein [Bacillus infantis]|uniref:hypothetical protein n=1 Tax=Bacillus infantis TaxID=324767 RepID=UPI003CEB9EF0
MNTLQKLLLATGILSLALAGCGTAEDTGNEDNGTNTEETAGTTEGTQETGDNSNGEDIEQTDDQTDDQSEGEENAETGSSEMEQEKSLSYQVNGETMEETAVLEKSDNQNYSMYVLPSYELTAEEPNKDVLYLTENDQVFMRIELLPEDTDWEMAEENAKSQLTAVSSEVQSAEASDDEFLQDAIIYEAASEEDKAAVYLIKNGGQPLKLSIYTKNDADHTDAFIQMAKTISAEK